MINEGNYERDQMDDTGGDGEHGIVYEAKRLMAMPIHPRRL
jgi:hypothetical protein